MASEFNEYYEHSDPRTALRLSQNATAMLSKSSLNPTSLALSILSAAETPQEWAQLEQTFYACLRVEDDESAHQCLDRLSKRFGAGNERILAMSGLYKEAMAKSDEELRKILQEYNKLLEEKPMNVPIHKRRIALIRSIGKPAEAISSLVSFLESFPTDVEAWCELSDLYQTQGMSAQAIFSLEEALLSTPNAWNLQARLGELNFLASQAGQEGTEASVKLAVEAIRRFARSIELCDEYLRGYYGLKLATDSLIKTGSLGKLGSNITESNVRQLNELATSKLRSIVQQWSGKTTTGFNESEVIAAQALLSRGS